MALIAPSLLAADFANLQRDIEIINKSEADYFHIDIMDGVFVPNISFGFPVTQAMAKHATKPMDFHLMIVNPIQYINQCAESGAKIISVHYEACNHLHSTLDAIKKLGCKAGIALNPHTPIEVLRDIIHDVDVLVLMSVNPGFGGQKFIQHTLEKVKRAKALINETQSTAVIEIDGGVNQQNAPTLIAAGADILVAGSFVFSAKDPIATIKDLKNS